VSKWPRIATRARVPLGFVFAAAYFWFSRPEWLWIAAGSVVVLSGVLVRAAASGHIRKNAALTTTGPYAYTRNPLYLGSLLIATGFLIAGRNWWIALAAAAMFGVIYVPVIRAEEKYLMSAFPGYREYRDRVPRLIPRWRDKSSQSEAAASEVFSGELYLKHREYNAALGSALMMGALILKMIVVRR
jgi:protein-S-isoprenylcysteine O-methyltransferase Ste14